jgi:hypothetical protein
MKSPETLDEIKPNRYTMQLERIPCHRHATGASPDGATGGGRRRRVLVGLGLEGGGSTC